MGGSLKIKAVCCVIFVLLFACDLITSKRKKVEPRQRGKVEIIPDSLEFDAFLVSPNSDSIRMSCLFNNPTQQILLLRVPKNSCRSCVNREIVDFRKYTLKDIKPKLLILSEYEDQRLFRAFSFSVANEKIPVFNCRQVLTTLDTQNKPYYLLINNKRGILKSFIVAKGDSKATIRFLNSIK